MSVISNKNYRGLEAVNQSKLKLIVNPALYKNYTPSEEDGEEKDYERFGTFQDKLLLGEDLWSQYIVCDVEQPSASLFGLAKHCYKKNLKTNDEILKAVKELDLWGNVVKEDVLVKKFDNTLFWNYIKFLQNSEGKTVLTQEEYDIAMHNYNNLLPIVKDMRPKVTLTGEYKGIKLKGELDYLPIIHSLKTYRVDDLKSTQDVNNFIYSALKYRYDFQIAFYEMLVSQNLDELGIPKNYTQSTGRWQVVSNQRKLPNFTYLNSWKAQKSFWDMGRYYIGVEEALERLLWHLETDKWDYPVEFYKDGYIKPKALPVYIETPIFKDTSLKLDL